MTETVPVEATPELFGPYRIEELLGRGGMGEVHRAYDTVHKRYVALKRLPRGAGTEFENRFRREAKIVAQLREPHVVPIHAHGEIDGRLYLDMRLIDGPDLKRLLADGPPDPARTIEILSQVAGALDAAHARDILHRDIKPGNILLDPAGTAYLADFGIARLSAPDVTRLTETGDYIGTPDYMAPERLTHGDIGPTSDVYSLACVLFQCLTGRVPFPAPDTAGKLTAQLNDPPPAASLFDRRIPPALDLVIQTGMEKDPRRRYPSAGELMAAASAALTANQPTAVDLPISDDPGQGYFVRLLAAVGGPQDDTRDAEAVPDRCPYPGLRSFHTEDSEWFFGREQAVRDLLARLSRQRADSGPLMVVGASGAGKSSLLHAGLLAAHTRASRRAPRLAMTPGEHPIATLAARLATFVRADPHQLAWQLRERPGTFGELCQRVVAGADAPLIIVVDQAEEMFTLCADPREREAFATALANAWPARVILAVRADFVAQCINLAALTPSVRAPYVLGPLSTAELAGVITKPAEAAGLEVEPGLVDRVIADVGGGRDPGALPRLAHAMRETWNNRSDNRLTLAGYQRTGGVDRAVALTAESVYARLSEFDRHALRAALLRMVTLLDGGGIARRQAHRADVPNRVMESLVAARLVTIDQDHVQLSHDALLTAWPRLREWVAEDRQGLLIRQQLAEAVARWRAGGRDRADLYRGTRLATALDWAAGRTDLTPDERALLQASDRDRRRRTRRLQGAVAGLATLLVITLVAGVLAVVARNDAERERVTALSRQLAAESLAEMDIDPVSAMRKAVEGWRTNPTTEARGAVLSAPLITYPAVFSSGLANVSAVDVNPDGTLIAVGNGDGKVVVWDVQARKRLDADITTQGVVHAVRFSPDGKFLATSALADKVDKSGGVRFWEIPSGREVARAEDKAPAIGQVAWHPDGKTVAALSARPDGTAAIGEWSPRTGKLIRWVTNGTFNAVSLAYDPGGDRIAVGRGDGSVELWNTATATLISRRTDHGDSAARPDGLAPVQVAYTGGMFASSSVVDNTIRLWDPRTGAPLRTFPDVARHATEPGKGPSSLAFSPDGGVLYTNSDANSISTWDPVRGNYLGSLPQGPRAGTTAGSTVVALAISRDGRSRVAANSDGTVLRWRTNTSWYSTPVGSVTALAFQPDGKTVTAGDADGGLYSWTIANGDQTSRTADLTGGVFGIQYLPDGSRITGTSDATFTLTSPAPALAKRRSVTLPGRAFLGRAMAVSPDGRWLAAAHQPANTAAALRNNKIHIWEAATLTERTVLDLGDQWPARLAFSPDGRELLALTSSGGTGLTGTDPDGDTAASMVTWRVPDFSGEEQHPLGTDSLTTVVYTPDGKTLITAGTSGTLQIRDAATGTLREEFGRHPSTVRQIAISPDGRTLASVTTEDSVIRLWDLASHDLIATLNSHVAPLNYIVFSPDGRRLASGGTDTDVAVWRLDPEAAARQVCANLGDAIPDDLDDIGCS
jgi:WD40 repeat protein/serine/threonine protein kinase